MELYFLKSAACLAILLLFYKLLLEKEDMHVFNRFYLLFSVVISFLVPFITFPSYIDVPAEPVIYSTGESSMLPPPPPPVYNTPIWQTMLWGLYWGGVLFFGIKFIINLRELVLKIRNNIRLKDSAYTKVLLKEEVAPHTFLDYIFLNKKKFEENRIPKEVFEHEQAHADQNHSYDILFMELLQVILWFHPLLYLTKNAIKLNHEFLADRSVLKKGTPAGEYQKMLLAFSSHASHGSLAHPINYSFIKKRFIVMKTQTSKWAIWARSLLVLPVAALLLYGFGTKEVVQRTAETNILTSNSEVLELLVDDFDNIYFGKTKTSLKKLQDHLKKNSYKSFSISRTENASEGLVKKILNIMSNHKLKGSVASCTTIDGKLEGTATAEMLKWYNEVAELINSMEDPRINSADVSKLNRIYLRMTPEQKKGAEPYPQKLLISVYSSNQEKATPEMLKEYNRLVKDFNSKSDKDMPIKVEDVIRMKGIYNLMTDKQKENSESFPAIRYKKFMESIFPPPPPAPPVPSNLDTPAPPPPPPAPLEHLKELAEKGAKFFISGKREVSAEEAIKLVENSKNISIKVNEKDSVTTVHISTTKR